MSAKQLSSLTGANCQHHIGQGKCIDIAHGSKIIACTFPNCKPPMRFDLNNSQKEILFQPRRILPEAPQEATI